MKIVVLGGLSIILFLSNQVRINMILLATIIWFIYTIYYCYNLYNLKDSNVVENKYLESPPNNNYSPYIRYLYNGKIDYKVFLLVVFELIIKGSISLKIENGVYYIFDNKVSNETLKKSEIYVKRILFKDIGENNYIVLNNLINKCSKNSGYIHTVYKEWENIFEYEATFNKYFKSNKGIIEKSTLFLIASFILSLYNIIFTRKIILGLFIFVLAAFISIYLNDLKIKEDEAQIEYENWMMFNNYIKKVDNNLNELDIVSLENYALYAYALDSYLFFKNTLRKNSNSYNESQILNAISLGRFDYIDYILKKSIDKLNINVLFLFAQNKGRR